jgi:hypothetical protein
MTKRWILSQPSSPGAALPVCLSTADGGDTLMLTSFGPTPVFGTRAEVEDFIARQPPGIQEAIRAHGLAPLEVDSQD